MTPISENVSCFVRIFFRSVKSRFHQNPVSKMEQNASETQDREPLRQIMSPISI